MFQPGEFVVYGSSGVCRVVQVGALEGRAADPNRKYYTLQPLFESERIYTPVDSGVFMRPAMTREQAQELIHEIPSIRAEICTERNPTTLRVHYEASLQSHECRRLISLIKGIRRKGEETEDGPGGPALPQKGREPPPRGAGHCPGHEPGRGGRVHPQNCGAGQLRPAPHTQAEARGEPSPRACFMPGALWGGCGTCRRCARSSKRPGAPKGPAPPAGGGPRPPLCRTGPRTGGRAPRR